MWDDKEFQLRCDSWDVRRESVGEGLRAGQSGGDCARARRVVRVCMCAPWREKNKK